MKKILQILILDLLLLINPAEAAPYKPKEISDLYFRTEVDEDIYLDSRVFDYTLSYYNSSSIYENYPINDVRFIIKDYFFFLKRYLESYGVSTNDCRRDYNLGIFIIPTSIMYDKDRFFSIYKMNSVPLDHYIYGYYDPTFEMDKNSTIVISILDRRDNAMLLTHELTHYWWDRLCLNNSFSNSEAFAHKISEIYVQGWR
jgi:hypothetical protein